MRDEFSTYRGNHDLRIGGEFLRNQNIYWRSNEFGVLTANLGDPPANLENLFPVWNDPSTWNLAPLSSISQSWTQSVARPGVDYQIVHPNYNIAMWLQDDWRVMPRLTVNLGVPWVSCSGRSARTSTSRRSARRAGTNGTTCRRGSGLPTS